MNEIVISRMAIGHNIMGASDKALLLVNIEMTALTSVRI